MDDAPVMKTFIEYREYDMYDSYLSVREVPTRDLKKLDLKKLDWGIPPTATGFPDEFRFFDAAITPDGKPAGTPVNSSKDYRVAETVMTLDAYKQHELPKLENYRQEKRGRIEAFCSSLLTNGFNLKDAFKHATGPKRPVMEWYIDDVTHVIAEAEKSGATHVYLPHPQSVAKIVTPDMIVLDKTLRQIYPLPTGRTKSKKPAP